LRRRSICQQRQLSRFLLHLPFVKTIIMTIQNLYRSAVSPSALPAFSLRVALLLLAVMLFQPAAGRQNQPIPDGLQLSFNGRFVNATPDGFRHTSPNGRYLAKYAIGDVGDEMRELLEFELWEGDRFLYAIDLLLGSDLLISNSGHVAVFDTRFHFRQQVIIHLFDKKGTRSHTQKFEYASLFGFSPQGNWFVVGTGNALKVISLDGAVEHELAHSSQFAFSKDEHVLATAKEDELMIYKNFEPAGAIETGFFHPRAIAVSDCGNEVGVIDKHTLQVYSTQNFEEIFSYKISPDLAYRDLLFSGDQWLAGVHLRDKGVSAGILNAFDRSGALKGAEKQIERSFQHFDEPSQPESRPGKYESIPWPFIPFDEMHTVWNYYEQHMGNGWDTWSYLHQGLDIITPIDEPTYAVQAGYVKCVLTLGGDAYWRVAISPLQEEGYSDGWLYAHLTPWSIQVEVGDYVQIHDYLGDIIYWSDDWGHIHFVEINDHGLIWYYDDDEWGINFNPLLALTPNNDTIAPAIHQFAPSTKFGFLEHGSSTNFLSPNNLYGDIEIIAKISDYHADSPWELPAFKTYYWFLNLDNNSVVVPKTLGRMLNHSYEYYSVAFYEDYAPILYYKSNNHLPPSWMSHSRDYYHILTRNSGDTLIDLSDLYLAFSTADFYDGNYMLYVEAWDDAGNMTVDSQQVYFNNGNISSLQEIETAPKLFCYPNPAVNKITIRYFSDGAESSGSIKLYNAALSLVKTIPLGSGEMGFNELTISIGDLRQGVYYLSKGDDMSGLQKFVVVR
jgi:hypothetical protein